jgi:hypothetical protein
MNKTLLIYFGKSQYGKPCRIGEIFNVAQASYFLGKEMGFEDGNIYLEWPHIKYNTTFGCDNRYFYLKPIDGCLPINFIHTHDIKRLSSTFFNTINLEKPNIFYDGCMPCSNSEKDSRKAHIPINYLNYYFLKYGKRPEIILPQKPHKFTILFHCRYSYYSEARNVEFEQIKELVSFIRKNFKDITINVAGDMYKPEMQPTKTLFDKVYNPFVRTLNLFINTVNNSDIIIGPQSGVADVANMIGKPIIMINSIDLENGTELEWGSNQYWKNLGKKDGEKHIYGKNCYTWKGEENYLNFPIGKPIDYVKIMEFIKKRYENK